jgi:hypothetical protein
MQAIQNTAKRLQGQAITTLGRSGTLERIEEITPLGMMVESQDKKTGAWKAATLVEWQWLRDVLDYYGQRDRELTKESLKVRGLKAQGRAPFIFALLVASGKFIETDDRLTTLVYRG